jgi:hypothetical protein
MFYPLHMSHECGVCIEGNQCSPFYIFCVKNRLGAEWILHARVLMRAKFILRTEGFLRKVPKMKHLPPNCLNQNANGTIWKLVSRASQWVGLPMLRGFDKLIEFSSILFSHYGDQTWLQSLNKANLFWRSVFCGVIMIIILHSNSLNNILSFILHMGAAT